MHQVAIIAARRFLACTAAASAGSETAGGAVWPSQTGLNPPLSPLLIDSSEANLSLLDRLVSIKATIHLSQPILPLSFLSLYVSAPALAGWIARLLAVWLKIWKERRFQKAIP